MKNFRLNLVLRILLLTLSIILFFYLYYNTELLATLLIISLIILYQIFSLTRFIDATNKELTRFLQSIKYSDFSQTFSADSLGSTFKELNEEFNEVILRFRKTRNEKEEHSRYLQTVIQHVAIGLISFNQEGKVEFINNSAKKMLRVPYLNHISDLHSVSRDIDKIFFNIKSNEKTTIKLVDENELVQLMVYATEFKLRDQKYKLISLQNIQSELEEKEMEAWQKLIRVLTHEIMNSITPISSLASTINNLLANGDDSIHLNEETINDIKSAVNTIQKRSEGLLHFVDNYRNLTKTPKPGFQIFQIKNLFERITKLMQLEFHKKNIKFISVIDPPSLEITADPDLIEQVLINLLINSVCALNSTDKPEIKLTAQLDDRSKVTIKVIDNGPGISEELQEKIFIPFFSTKKNGSGIGLSLSRQIIRSHGGSIRVVSKPNTETIFILKF